MKNICLFVALGILFTHYNTSNSKFSSFSWLQGKWERTDTREGQYAFEEWNISDSGLSGRGVTIQNGDTVFIELLAIGVEKNEFFYRATVPNNPEPTTFKITDYSEDGFTCENPNHDFPKMIDYKRTPDGMVATISGDGKSMDFRFKKPIK